MNQDRWSNPIRIYKDLLFMDEDFFWVFDSLRNNPPKLWKVSYDTNQLPRFLRSLSVVCSATEAT